MPSGSSADLPVEDERPHDVEVLLVDAETEYLIQLLDRIDRDTDALAVHTSREVEETIDRLEDGEVDCLVCTYDGGRQEGLELLEYVREHPVDVPVVMLPSRETTIIDSRNLVADVNSVFTREEAVDAGVLGPHLVDVVEQQRASVAAERRSQVEDVMGRVARDIAGAEASEEVDESVTDRLAAASAFDAGWVAAVDDDDDEAVEVRATTADDPEDVPGVSEAGPAPALLEAVRRAVEEGEPRRATLDEQTYALLPVTPGEGDRRALAVCSDSRFAFRAAEMDLLGELGETMSRTLETIATRQALESRVDDLELVEELIQQVGVGVVVYGPNGFVDRANEAFAELVDVPREDLEGTAVWNLLPTLEVATFEEAWRSLSPSETAVRTAELGGREREFVTTRVEVDDDPYDVTMVVDPGEGAPLDEEQARLLSYEFRHWLDLAREAVGEARDRGDPERLQLVDELVDRMGDAIETEVRAVTDPDEGPTMEPQPLGELARVAWNHVLGEAATHEVRGSRTVYAHHGLLLRVFEHLFRTLLTYAEDLTAVDVGVTADGFYVEDDGAGVPHAEREYADAWRAAPERTESGAGILIAERAAERMGWSLDVAENEAGGTRFHVSGVRYADESS